jgi:hypothetical protein
MKKIMWNRLKKINDAIYKSKFLISLAVLLTIYSAYRDAIYGRYAWIISDLFIYLVFVNALVDLCLKKKRKNIPQYQCHKKVGAFEIGKIEGCMIYPLHDDLEPVKVDFEFIDRHPLNQPGYLVFYEDGYMSFSPKKAFEDGYTAI